jgi:hypothetical protein
MNSLAASVSLSKLDQVVLLSKLTIWPSVSA